MASNNPLCTGRYGFYNPQLTTFYVIPDQTSILSAAFAAPLTSASQTNDFLSTVSQALPSFGKIDLAVASHAISVHTDSGASHIHLGSATPPEKTLFVPHGAIPLEHLSPLIGALAPFCPQPNGVSAAFANEMKGIEDASAAFQARLFWQMALNKSMEFQIANEMNRAGLDLDEISRNSRFMSDDDMALFKLFREQGLGGLARAYAESLTPEAQEVLDEATERQVGRTVQAGIDVFSALPEGDAPALKAEGTYLDRRLESLPYDKLPEELVTKEDVERTLTALKALNSQGSYEKVDSWFDLVDLEKHVLKLWEDLHAFEQLRMKNRGNQPWSFLDGPITANNPMGVHHAWGRTLKDAFQRFHAMSGRDLRYQNGFDCQGLWVEVEVEKELGIGSKADIEQIGIDRFVDKCKARVERYADRITDQSKRLGFWMDWGNSYFTMSNVNNYTIWQFLKRAHERGLIYKGNDVMPWCPRCGTGISQHEMQEGYKDVEDLSVSVKFPLTERENESLLVWTTTPWTLSSNVATAVNPDSTYAKVSKGGHTYYLLEGKVLEVFGDAEDYEVLETMPGSELVGLKYRGPYDDLPAQAEVKDDHRVVAWSEVTEDTGTGLVHIAPGCGAEDFELGRELDLHAVAPLDENGIFLDGFGWMSGKNAHEIGDEVRNDLIARGVLFADEMYTHSYPHCWRCSTPLLFRLVDEWFISMDPWREEIMRVAKQITWIPSFGLSLELDWLKNMHDWMISKKRYWGLALPIWECEDCGHAAVIGGKEELKGAAIEGWDEFDGHSPHRPWVDGVKIACPECGGRANRVKDVGNPWLDAGIVPYSTVGYDVNPDEWRRWIPADLVLECFPGQFRNWFYSLLAMSTMMENIPPFKTLVGHALVKDEKGEEMHKSAGNAIWFDDAADKMGVDVMRWIYASHELTNNLNFGYDSAKAVRGRFINTLWNSYAFFVNYAALADNSWRMSEIPISERPDFDRWIISKLNILVGVCREAFEKHDIRTATRHIEDFVNALSKWYIRNNRRRFWKTEMDRNTMSAYQTLHEAISTVARLAAPIIPFITEQIYQTAVRPSDPSQPLSVHLTDYPVADPGAIDRTLVEDMDAFGNIVTAALSAREKAKIRIKQPLAKLIISPKDERENQAIERFKDLLESELNVKSVEFVEPGAKKPAEVTIRPNKATIGRRHKAGSGSIVSAIEANADRIRDELLKGGDVSGLEVESGGISHRLNMDELMIDENDPDDMSIVDHDGGWIALELTLTDALIEEGRMRDFLRGMQVLRKKIGLNVEDRIRVGFNTSSDAMSLMIENYSDYLRGELLSDGIRHDAGATDHEIKIGKDTVMVTIRRL